MNRLNLNLLDTSIIFVAALGAATGWYCLNNSALIYKIAGVQSTTASTIGELSFIEQDVRRRMSRSILWQPIMQSEYLFEKDSLFTGKNSTAVIALNNGDTIELAPNSLVFLDTQSGELNLDLQIGSIKANIAKGKSIKIKQGTSSVRVKGSGSSASVKIQKSKKKLEINSVKGTAKIEAKGVTQDISKEKAVEISPTLTVKKIIRDVVLISPQEAKEEWINPDKGLAFNWDPKEHKSLNLQLSAYSNFNKLALDKPTKGDKMRVRLSEGDFWWRLTNQEGEALSPTQRLKVVYNSAPSTTTPKQKDNLFVDKEPPAPEGYPVNFIWQEKYGASFYTLQVASDSDFTKLVKESNTEDTLAKAIPLPAGNFYWRVQAVSQSNQTSYWSEPIEFTVGTQTKKEIVPITEAPFKPPAIAEKPFWDEPFVELTPEPPPAPKPVPLKQPIVAKLSDIEKKVDRPEDLESLALDIPLTWEPVERAKAYKVIASTSPDFKKVAKQEITRSPASSFNTNANGTYFFKVIPLDETNKPGGPSSKVQKVKVKKYFELRTPAMVSNPSSDIKVVSFGNNTEAAPVIFSWEPVEFASSYTIQFAKDSNFSEVVGEEKLSKTSYVLKLKLPVGKIHWRIRAESPKFKSPWSDPKDFVSGT